ncbi:alpha/beta-hydrolase [Tuber magnatum]|uniref:Alpha/beta-hydrolase n=1 Tax=Tuber magnatum TaxID=42249 RepID=A0A317SKB7_9PEZI|nr:alpha/beta-hydrolase [Tuber magnatum]
MQKIPPATLLECEEYTITGGIRIVDRWFRTALDYSNPGAGEIALFARNAMPGKKGNAECGAGLPFFLYLQAGGPGFECGPPENHPLTNFLFDKGFQVLYLDQRGTGMSTPISPRMLQGDGGKERSVEEQAEYVKLFRADNIVRDCEAVRHALLGRKEKEEDRKWGVIGQSFGGFCAVTYLSFYPEGLREVFTTGGMPPLVNSPDEVYKALWEKVKLRNQVYYKKYPLDVGRVKNILKYLAKEDVRVPNGGRLTPRRFLGLGLSFGGHGGIDGVHNLVQRAHTDIKVLGHLSYKVLQSIQGSQCFDGNVLYALVHEPIYCQHRSANWSALRTKPDDQEFNLEQSLDKEGQPVYFTGEMIFPWTFEDYAEVSKLEFVARILAEDAEWPSLYCENALAKNEVPVYAATYMEDMYVDYTHARRTAGKIRGAKEFVTNTLMHNAVRARNETVMGELWRLRSGEVD